MSLSLVCAVCDDRMRTEEEEASEGGWERARHGDERERTLPSAQFTMSHEDIVVGPCCR